ncbi:glutamyl-tRNA reductase [Clavibacter michiganensis subsp. michiganensis]|uniref:Glutamyl-tRNA reductase n=1 Tax=Clavibacter michiganensis subsp. michiganensis TaxID=33013 RepID=A0A251XFD3_CLAMM|nr:glutamyl-tRNA reductase [Clavibacter michiganensis subsp. michiganensis]OUE01016.1 glutamyl-tRNA reductase [Clavibacter michiganensis subsp. michiganensis]
MLICLTASHHNASFEVLEKLSVAAPSVAGALMEQNDFIAGAVVLATCNRFEAYLDVEEPLTAAARWPSRPRSTWSAAPAASPATTSAAAST